MIYSISNWQLQLQSSVISSTRAFTGTCMFDHNLHVYMNEVISASTLEEFYTTRMSEGERTLHVEVSL